MKLDRVMTIHVDVDAPLTTGPTPAGESRVVPFRGGRFEGDALRGELLAGGSDWQRVRANGVLEIGAHYMLGTDEGETIEVRSEGLRSASPEVLARLAAGEALSADAYYFRTFVRLATSAPRLAWMNDRLFIGSGERRAEEVEITVYEVP